MSLNETVSAERIHIGFFGMRNAGKSSVVNAVTGQDLAVVSDVKGTTTDPVKKAMELLPLGPVVIIDTPGLDDEGELGALRVQKARRVLAQTDIAVLVVDAAVGLSEADKTLLNELKSRDLPHILVYNKADLLPEIPSEGLYVSAKTGKNIDKIKELLVKFEKKTKKTQKLVSDLVSPGDVVVLVVPIDSAAPKGRLILPQQQTIRDLLDTGCTVVTCRDEELPQTLACLKAPPRLVITDSQVFGKVVKLLPEDQLLTSFSILFARYKGELGTLVEGASKLCKLSSGDRVLISEGCTHHRQCGDIGTVKLPNWIRQASGAEPEFEFTSGGTFPEDLSRYTLIVHCGGCMLNEAEMQHRMRMAKDAGVPMVNYGAAIAAIHGILKRSLEVFQTCAD